MVSPIFQTSRGASVPKADTVNRAGGKAYSLSAQQALAQYSVTGCFGDVFYANADEQLKEVAELAAKCEPLFVAKCAVYARTKGHMKDMPAYLLAHLTTRGHEGLMALRAAWPHVIDNGKMLRNFVQIIRSGAVGRKSMGTAVKRLVQSWLNGRYADGLFRDNVGEKPSMVDVIKMVHPKPVDDARKALYGYLLDKEHNAELLSPLVRHYEAFKRSQRVAIDTETTPVKKGKKKLSKTEVNFEVSNFEPLSIPDVPFQMLDSLGLTDAQWKEVARKAGWQMTRMNLNTFKRHGVLDDKEMVKLLAKRLSDPDEVKKARVFPYQLLMAFKAASDVPRELTEALQDAMDSALVNVPTFEGDVVVALDISTSMRTPVTGARKGATSNVSCQDAAALFAAALIHKNRKTRILAFSDDLMEVKVNPRDSVMTLARQLASLPSGGTDCSLPMKQLNSEGARADLVIYLSDNESWMDRPYGGAGSYFGRNTAVGTTLAHEWAKFKTRNSRAKLVCIDMSPNATTQATSGVDRLNVGGFSDAVFDVIDTFVKKSSKDTWVDTIQKVEIEFSR